MSTRSMHFVKFKMSKLKILLFTINTLLFPFFTAGEIVQLPNLTLYHVTPRSPDHIKELNRLRTMDSGIIFINGIGIVGEVTEAIATQEVLDYYGKDLTEIHLHFDPQFNPVTIEMSNNGETKPQGRSLFGSREEGGKVDGEVGGDEGREMEGEEDGYVESKRRKRSSEGRGLKGLNMKLPRKPLPKLTFGLPPSLKGKAELQQIRESEMVSVADKKAPKSSKTKTEASSSSYKKPKLVKIEPIHEPEVHSGIFLTLSSASKYHSDWDSLSYGIKVNSTMGNPYLCLSKTQVGDDHDHSKKWLFEETEQKGYYILRNYKLLDGYVTWEDDEEQYLVIEQRKETRRWYKTGGPYRKNVLFHITKRGTKSFELSILGTDGKNTHVVIDPNWADTTGCLLLRRTSKERTSDGDYLEYLFKIKRTPGSLKVYGHIGNLKYRDTVDQLYERAKGLGTVSPVISKTVYNHGDFELHFDIEDYHERRDKFHLKFVGNDSMSKAFDQLHAPAGLGIAKATLGKDEKSDPGLFRLDLSPGKDTVQRFKYKISGGLHVPPWSSLQYTIMFGWLEKLKMLYEGELKIFGRADRLIKSENKPRIAPNQIVNFHLVKQVLTARGFMLQGKKVLRKDDESETVFIEGTIIAKTLGIKGDIEVNIEDLSKSVNVQCKNEKSN